MTTQEIDALTPEQLRVAVAEAMGIPRMFVLLKRGLYYRKNGNGYTNNYSEAWMLTEEEAKKHVYPHDEPVTMHVAKRFPDYCNSLDALRPVLEKLMEMDEEKSCSSRPQDYPSLRFVTALSKEVDLGIREEICLSGQLKPDGTPFLLSTYFHSSPFETMKLILATPTQVARAALKALNP